MIRLAKPCILAVLCLAGCIGDRPDGDLRCAFRRPIREVNSFDLLPQNVQDYLKPRFNFDDPHTGGIAPKGGEWNATDVVRKDAPFRRFIRAGHWENKWFLWYERGGIAYFRELAIFDAEGKVLVHTSLPSSDPCKATDAAFAGEIPGGIEPPW